MRIRPETTPDELYPHVLAALRAWHSSGPDHLLDFLLLVRAQNDGRQGGDPAARRHGTNTVLLEGLDELSEHVPEDSELLRARFPRQETILQVAFSLNLSEDQVNRRQKKAVTDLCAILLQRELDLRSSQARLLEARLPARQYSRLFGIAAAADEIGEKLLPDSPPWVVSLTGMGGIGKTALAHHLALQTVSDYGVENIHWVHTPAPFGPVQDPEETYRSILNDLAERLTPPEGSPQARRDRVRKTLKVNRCLVVVDNLESESDTAFLLESLFGLAEPTKFLLTTRAQAAGPAGVYVHRMRELAFADAAAFVRAHSEEIGLGELAITKEEDLQLVYRAVGGNPLALKIVVGLTASLPLPAVLADLGDRRLHETGRMYSRIFEHAWNALSADARALLAGMPLVAESASPEHLAALSGLPPSHFWPALHELQARSLIEAYGTATERRFGIHPLTRRFLEADGGGQP